MKKRTFVDSGVLLTAFRGVETEAEDAFKILEDPNREFVSSILVQMELVPKAIYHRNEKEIRFYDLITSATCSRAFDSPHASSNQGADSAKPLPSLVCQDCADQIVNYYWGVKIFN
jgi:hypothetical protein